MTQQERNELEQDLKYDAYLEAQEEIAMRDEDYALSKFESEISEAYDRLQRICKMLDTYGHSFTPSQLMQVY